jgi:hypothetical protein
MRILSAKISVDHTYPHEIWNKFCQMGWIKSQMDIRSIVLISKGSAINPVGLLLG